MKRSPSISYPIWQLNRSEQSLVWQIPNPPDVLYLQGQESALSLLNKLPEFGLAVVGTRRPQQRSRNLVQNWLSQLSKTNIIIISGLALGIDAVAHLAAVEAGLKTIAVLGCGFNFNYPQENSDLRRKILDSGGLIVSEFAKDIPALKHHFLKRNRIIAGWAKATWVVEAGYRSGALNTARWARDQDRVCFAVPNYPGDPTLAGNQVLLDRDHALPTWGVHSFGAVWLELATLGLSRPLIGPGPGGNHLSNDEVILFEYLWSKTLQEGGAQLQDLSNWFHSESWTKARFFSALSGLTQKKKIYEKFGTWFVVV